MDLGYKEHLRSPSCCDGQSFGFRSGIWGKAERSWGALGLTAPVASISRAEGSPPAAVARCRSRAVSRRAP